MDAVDRLRIRPPTDISTKVRFAHDTLIECLACGRVWKATAVPGLIHGYVSTCPSCTPLLWLR